MAVRVGIVDYQMGNLRSVQKAVERIGYEGIVTGDCNELSQVSHLILPGVGAFGDAMSELKKRHLVLFLQEWAESEKPFLGICLGMQLLFETSQEGGSHEGLAILPGQVLRFHQTAGMPSIKIPHMGWNQVKTTRSNDELLANIQGDPFFYFVHSYYVKPTDEEMIWLQCEYGSTFCAAVRRDRLVATQFHPEKSQRDGLQLLTNFLKM
jgi:glutamine amidotransferase